jgi:hypothetical protein
LRYKGVIDFKNGLLHTIARTSDGKVYVWGRNSEGVIGNGLENEDFLCEPKLNELFIRKKLFISYNFNYNFKQNFGDFAKNCPLNPMSLPPLEIWKFSELAPPGARYLAKLCL